jgi:hypothetical protein
MAIVIKILLWVNILLVVPTVILLPAYYRYRAAQSTQKKIPPEDCQMLYRGGSVSFACKVQP